MPLPARFCRLVALLYFGGSIVALTSPVFGWLGNHIEPRVLGLPWSLVYVLLIVAANFGVLVFLYRRDPEDAHRD